MLAAATGNCDVVKELISLGADVDSNQPSKSFPMFHHDTSKWFRTSRGMFHSPEPRTACVNCLYSCHIHFTYGILSLWDIQLTLTDKVSGLGKHIINPRRACAARVTVLGLTVCECVPVSCPY